MSVSNKHLIKIQDKIHILSKDEWQDITENIADVEDIAQEEFKEYGMDSIEDIDMKFLNTLDDFQILMWTDDKEFNEEKEHKFTNEQVVDYGKLFKHTLESKEDILDIYVK